MMVVVLGWLVDFLFQNELVINNVMRGGKIMFNYVQCMTIRDSFTFVYSFFVFVFNIYKKEYVLFNYRIIIFILDVIVTIP